MMDVDVIARDLGRKISDQLEAVLQRELRIAQAVLPAPQLSIMLMKVASGVSIAAVLVVVQMAKDGADEAELFDLALSNLHDLDRKAKHRAFELLAKARAVA